MGKQMTWTVATEWVNHLVWPLTVLLLVWFLRKEIRLALGRLEAAKLGGAELSFGKVAIDRPQSQESAALAPPVAPQFHASKTGSIFWLGHDIMWTIDALLRGANTDAITYGLRQSLHHLTELGLDTSSLAQTLEHLFAQAQKLPAAAWTPAERESFALELDRLADQLGGIAAANQPGFRAYPVSDPQPSRAPVSA